MRSRYLLCLPALPAHYLSEANSVVGSTNISNFYNVARLTVSGP